MGLLKCAVMCDGSQEHGYVSKPDHPFNKLMAELVKRTIQVLLTPRASASFQDIARKWLSHHRIQGGDSRQVTRKFLHYVQDASHDLSQWPTMVTDWTLPADTDAIYDANRVTLSSTNRGLEYNFSEDYIHVNGLRLSLLAYDRHKNAKEQHIRMFELVVTLCHEMSHFFITHLNFEHHIQAYDFGSPPETVPGETFGADPEEAGYSLERRLFGGIYVRGIDSSMRGLEYMPGLPLLATDNGQKGISLDSILSLANHPANDPYTDAEITIQRVNIDESHSDPKQIFPSFFHDFQSKFHKQYSPPGKFRCDDSTLVPRVISLRVTNQAARKHPGARSGNHGARCRRKVLIFDGQRVARLRVSELASHQSRPSQRGSPQGGLHQGLQALSLNGHDDTTRRRNSPSGRYESPDRRGPNPPNEPRRSTIRGSDNGRGGERGYDSDSPDRRPLDRGERLIGGQFNGQDDRRSDGYINGRGGNGGREPAPRENRGWNYASSGFNGRGDDQYQRHPRDGR